MNKICIICGKPFQTAQPKQICCSKDCTRERRHQMQRLRYRLTRLPIQEERICPVCGKTFKPKSRKQFICSKQCASKRQLKQEAIWRKTFIDNTKFATCQNCGVRFKKTFNNEKFCSDKCREKYFSVNSIDAFAIRLTEMLGMH